MLNVICDGGLVSFLQCHLTHIDMLNNMIDDTNTCGENAEVRLSISYEYMKGFKVLISAFVSQGLDGLYKDISTYSLHDLFNIVNVAHYLDCSVIYSQLIIVICSYIRSYDIDALRYMLREERGWDDDEYAEVLQKDKWCKYIPQCQSPLLLGTRFV